jgi:hypothetical protein
MLMTTSRLALLRRISLAALARLAPSSMVKLGLPDGVTAPRGSRPASRPGEIAWLTVTR